MDKGITYEELVRAIGPGFHPDTAGDDYMELPEGVTPELVDELVEQAHQDTFYHGMTDPYTRAIEALANK